MTVTTTTASGDPTLTVLANDGSGAFPTQSNYPVRPSPQAITPIDADGDGLMDLAVPCKSADGVVVLFHRTPAPALATAPRVPVGDKPRAAVVGDLDGGDRLDGFAARDGEDTRLVSARDAPGAFGAVEAGALGGAHCLVAELGVPDVGRLDGE